MMKKATIVIFLSMVMLSAYAGGAKEATVSSTGTVYPAGTVVIYGYGQPQYLQQYYDAWLERNRDIAPEVKIEIVQTQGAADSREKVTMTYLAGVYDDLPDALYIDPVNLKDLAAGGIVKDETALANSLKDQMVDGASGDAIYKDKIFALPESVRPQVLFFNQEIFDKYGVDPAMMSTMEGYIEAGRQLKEKSNGLVYLSYIDPGSRTWRYWGRRGLMPQANARIWGENGDVVFGSDPGVKLALNTLDTLYSEGLLLKSAIMQPALYDAIRENKVATFYIGAFWDEFLRKNVSETSGQWRVMPAPVFAEIGTAGAPVASYFAIINKPNGKYTTLVEKLWKDFQFDNEPRKAWVNAMVEQNAPYANPISLEMLEDPFWKESSEFYGGQSFREMEGKGLANSSANLIVTPKDAEADTIISVEIEKYVAGNQTMQATIANIDKNLKARIGKTTIE
ncbi:ABC-type sugar transport system, periplasmic component [Sphaerochaeta pleomorpha str. Grapes]|uniref:ABC-type sugar transport system, periplasmic component n=1 Tax=Sphaerochaeta pleomorpha (strain ATCC BAA-1885 / DSM 22778 / Grapes) TaxID=158190 RepID=G8QTQ0_SPHPG|nr:ABC transporter substrate-binding protein [Sphaerochaeta pleomorpha]AEV28015.1 ABC-type sugar transport system, periplasmic component [Sphaerochaeta pleomorpha str. Grapes]